MGAFLNRQSDREKPRTKFKNSLFTTTKKCAHEQAGVLLCVLLSLLSDRGRQICIEERTMANEWIENQVYILELILMVEIWLKKDDFPREQVMDPHRLSKAIGLYMDRLAVICPRGGMGTLLIKNHLMFHLPEYIIRWGPPNGWDSSTLERSHKNQAKRPAMLTQQHPETFLKQLAGRYSDLRLVKRFRDFFSIDKLMDPKEVCPYNDVDIHLDVHVAGDAALPKTSGSPFTIGIDTNGRAGVKWKKRPGRQTHVQYVQDVVAEVVLSNIAQNLEPIVTGFTEYKVELHAQPQIFRAHPSYRSTSRQQRDVWYDWAMFDLAKQGCGSKPIPGQILMFIHVPMLHDEVKYQGVRLLDNCPHAVVRLFTQAPTDAFRSGQISNGRVVPYSSIVKFGRTHHHLTIIPCPYIVGTAIVIPNIEMKKPNSLLWNGARKKRKRQKLNQSIAPLGEGYFVIEPRHQWGETFGSLIESFPST